MTLTVKTTSNLEMQDDSKIVSERAFHTSVKRISFIIKEILNSSQSDQLSIERTKNELVIPLLEGLGWDRDSDIIHEPEILSKEFTLDIILNCKAPVGIVIRPLHEPPPKNIEYPQIKFGLRQCEVKKVPYFIWTNGDSWLFFSMALANANAPFYNVCLSKIDDDISLLDRLLIIRKDILTSNQERFTKAISKNRKLMALSHAWMAMLQDHTKELLQVFRKGLKHNDFKDEVILKFLKTFKSESMMPQSKSPISFKPESLPPQQKSSVSFKSKNLLPQSKSPDREPRQKNWERLISSYESPYRLARWFFRTSYYRKLGEFLISDGYRSWPRDSTWRHLGLSDGKNDEKKVRHAMILFQEWGFIEKTGADEYCRVEGCSPYLKKLLEHTTLH